MNNKIPDLAKPIGEVTIVKDFLPPPEQLVPKKTVRVTMEFSQETIEYFKREAKQSSRKTRFFEKTGFLNSILLTKEFSQETIKKSPPIN